MEKPQVTRHWKDIHLRKDSADSLNDSVHSNRSSVSAGYTKFNFRRPEDQPKKSAVFHFTPRNKDNPHDISLLIKRNQDREVNRPRDSSAAPRLNTLEKMVRRMNSITVDKDKIADLNTIIKEVTSVISSLKQTFEYLQNQIKELQVDWKLAMKQITNQQIDFEHQEIKMLKKLLQEKELEIQKITKEQGSLNQQIHIINHQARAEPNGAEPPLSNLAISAVDMARPNEERFLSRNNTLSSLLAG